MTSTNPLSASSLASLMTSALPPQSSLRNPYDAIALLCHACMLAVEFRLVGFGEEHRIRKLYSTLIIPHSIVTGHIDTTNAHQAPPEGDDQSNPVLLPSEWNSSGTSSYSFRYSHAQSSMEYLLKINRMGTKAVIMGMGLGDDRTASFDVAVKDYISGSALPFSFSGSNDDDISSEQHQEEQPQEEDRKKERLKEIFISIHRLSDLASLFKLNILQRIIPGLHKEGYRETSSSNEQSSSSEPRGGEGRGQPRRGGDDDDNGAGAGQLPQPARPYPYDDPLALPPRRNPYPAGDFPPPGFEDEYEILRPPRGIPPGGPGGIAGGGRGGYPVGIGHDDLYPPGLGPRDPLQGPFMPGPGLGGRPQGGGGMHPTFDDPLFGGGGGGGEMYDPR